jgi:Dinucleotide-utilizing enzymes involved in molybdopterin and thiamine biosynthesis family 1
MTTLAHGLIRYFSAEQLARLGEVTVGIVGAGGLGSNIAVMLVRSGIKRLTIVDHDVVEASNLNRQAYLPTDVGTPKVLALSWHLQMLEPEVKVAAFQTEATRENAATLFAACPVMVEAVDGAATKAMLYEAFAASKELYVTASGMCGFGETEPMRILRPRENVVAVGDFTTGFDADHPPLAPRVMQAAAMQADAVLAHVLSRHKHSCHGLS